MSFKNRWTIRSSYDFQEHQQCFQRRCCFSQTALLWFEVLPDLSPVLAGGPRLVVGAPRPVASAPSYSEGRQECPPRVWYSPEIAASKFTLHILSDTPGGLQWLNYILLMYERLIPGQACLNTSAKCNYVTGSLWECLRVVEPESQGGQIPEFNGPTQWPSGAPGSTWERWWQQWERRWQAWERRRQAWEHLESVWEKQHLPWEHCWYAWKW